jgi:serine/threonine protein kinase
MLPHPLTVAPPPPPPPPRPQPQSHPQPHPHPRSGQPWSAISEAAKDAVRSMMTWSADARPSARDMLEHEWIRKDGVASDTQLQPEVGAHACAMSRGPMLM